MTDTSWLRQTSEPAFPDLLWERPENKRNKAHLALIGGSGHQFASVQEAFAAAEDANAGDLTMALPETLNKVVPNSPMTVFMPASKTNAFARDSVGPMRQVAEKADATLFTGDLGRSNETVHAVSALLMSSSRKFALTKDAINMFYHEPHILTKRDNTVIVASFSQLQKLLIAAGLASITSTMGLAQLVEIFKRLDIKATLVTRQHGNFIVSDNGKVSTTKDPSEDKTWQVKTATYCAVLLGENHPDRFKAITSAIHLASKTK